MLDSVDRSSACGAHITAVMLVCSGSASWDYELVIWRQAMFAVKYSSAHPLTLPHLHLPNILHPTAHSPPSLPIPQHQKSRILYLYRHTSFTHHARYIILPLSACSRCRPPLTSLQPENTFQLSPHTPTGSAPVTPGATSHDFTIATTPVDATIRFHRTTT